MDDAPSGKDGEVSGGEGAESEFMSYEEAANFIQRAVEESPGAEELIIPADMHRAAVVHVAWLKWKTENAGPLARFALHGGGPDMGRDGEAPAWFEPTAEMPQGYKLRWAAPRGTVTLRPAIDVK